MEKIKEIERLRNKSIHIMTTQQEYDMIKKNMEQAGHNTVSGYLIELGTKGFVLNVDYSSLNDLCYEVHKIGVNINQVAHKVNAEDIETYIAVTEIREQMNALVHMVRSQFYKIP